MFVHKICKSILLKYKEKENSNISLHIFVLRSFMCFCREEVYSTQFMSCMEILPYNFNRKTINLKQLYLAVSVSICASQ